MQSNEELEQEQLERYRDKEETLTAKRAKLLGLSYIDGRKLGGLKLNKETLNLQEMYDNHIIALEVTEYKITYGITLETPQNVLRDYRERSPDKIIQFMMISAATYRELMLRYDPPPEVKYDDITVSKEGDSDNLSEVSKKLEEVKAEDILDYLISQADRLNASDIHTECAREMVRVRFRINGTLHVIATMTHEKYTQLQQAIAVRANISRNAPDAQTGHLSQTIHITGEDGQPDFKILNMRIETVPTVFGQDAVIRLFNFDADLLNLDNLGLSPRERAPIDEVISRPHGLVLMVGPTGSGKTTTLYSILNRLKNPNYKILTLEDPVEYTLDGMSQIPVSTQTGDSFAEKLRAVMRLDPDVIMVGEIRDVDTAKTAMQASVTGHLVLSTFHASSASAALSRMIDMIGNNPIFISAIKLIVSQRLVRRLDDETKQEYEPDEALKDHIRRELANLPDDVDKPDLDNFVLYRPGSSDENPFGYSGRLTILEELIVDEEIQDMLRDPSKIVTINQIEDKAKSKGMLTMYQDGLLKAIAGITTVEEINRVV